MSYLQRNFGKESVQPFFTDTVQGRYWSSLSNLGEEFIFMEDEKIQNILFYAERQELWKLDKSYNTFRVLYLSDYEKSNDVVDCFFRNDTVIVSTDEKVFTIPLKEVVLKYLSADVDLRNKQEMIVKESDFSLVINNLHGNYFPEKDSLFVDELRGYLFYNLDNEPSAHK